MTHEIILPEPRDRPLETDERQKLAAWERHARIVGHQLRVQDELKRRGLIEEDDSDLADAA